MPRLPKCSLYKSRKHRIKNKIISQRTMSPMKRNSLLPLPVTPTTQRWNAVRLSSSSSSSNYQLWAIATTEHSWVGALPLIIPRKWVILIEEMWVRATVRPPYTQGLLQPNVGYRSPFVYSSLHFYIYIYSFFTHRIWCELMILYLLCFVMD